MQKKNSLKINTSSLNNKNNTKIIDNTTTVKYSNKLKNISSYILSSILWKTTKSPPEDNNHKNNNSEKNISINSNNNNNSIKGNDIYISDAHRLKIKRASEIQRINKLNSINNNIISNNNNNNNNNTTNTNSITLNNNSYRGNNTEVIDQKSLRDNNINNNNNNVLLNVNPAYKDRYSQDNNYKVTNNNSENNYDSYNTSSRLSNILSQRNATNNNTSIKSSSNKRDNYTPATHKDSISHTINEVKTSTVKTESTNPPAVSSILCCDKCDGKHLTDDCPYYKKARDQHPDAQKKNKNQLGCVSTLPGSTLKHVQVIRQPGDGSCLFHSMAYGLNHTSNNNNYNNKCNASKLRAEICTFIQNNPNLKISDTPLQDWVKWDSGTNVLEYSKKMSRGSWGGGIEMACVSQLKECNVHVYERIGTCYKRISAFDHPLHPENKPIIKVLYCGGIHYDAIEDG